MSKVGARIKKWLLQDGLNIIVISAVTGVFAGLIVTLYDWFVEVGEWSATSVYELLLENPAFIPLLFVCLAAGALVIGTVCKLIPILRGNGMPQTEGAARGLIRFKWYIALCSMFAASLACIFLGLSSGGECPGAMIGGSVGSGTSTLLKRNQMVRRLQICAGASAGIAIISHAPITGLVFALEEAFRSFSPRAFICAAIAIILGLLTRYGIGPLIELESDFSFTSFDFSGVEITCWSFCLWALLAAVVVAVCAMIFYYLVFLMRRLFRKITFWKGIGKFLIPFLFAGVAGLISVYSIGGGHSFIYDLGTGGTGEFDIVTVFGLGVAGSLAIIVLLRFVASILNMGCALPCGAFYPMLAIGAGLGALLSILFQEWGMDPAYSDYLVAICMSVFFTTNVKAPITGIVVIFEFTGQFTNPLPALIGIAIAYIASTIFRHEPLYERMLGDYIEEQKVYEKSKEYRLTFTVKAGCEADGRAVRDVIWPSNGLLISLMRTNGSIIVPDGETIIRPGDKFIFLVETDDEKETREYMDYLVGKQEEGDGIPLAPRGPGSPGGPPGDGSGGGSGESPGDGSGDGVPAGEGAGEGGLSSDDDSKEEEEKSAEDGFDLKFIE